MKTKKKGVRKKRNTRKKINLDFTLLKELTKIHAPSAEEDRIINYIVDYTNKNKHKWAVKPKIFHGGIYRNNVVLVFGKPRVAVFSHIDSVGFMVGHKNTLTRIGGPNYKNGFKLQGFDNGGKVTATLRCKGKKSRKQKLTYTSRRPIEMGTNLTYVYNWRETPTTVQVCSQDDRMGTFVALKLAETLKNGALVFTMAEETGGGDIEFLAKILYEKYKITKALISDIIPTENGITLGGGAIVSYRDRNIPRRSYVEHVLNLVRKMPYKFQIEVGSKGGNDGANLITAPAPFDWCQIGVPVKFYHSPNEKTNKADALATLNIYKALMKKL
tara:strand:- start:3037 stop:4023 length:987 start_codon:yes stop_codon:yes gene_type:complete